MKKSIIWIKIQTMNQIHVKMKELFLNKKILMSMQAIDKRHSKNLSH